MSRLEKSWRGAEKDRKSDRKSFDYERVSLQSFPTKDNFSSCSAKTWGGEERREGVEAADGLPEEN